MCDKGFVDRDAGRQSVEDGADRLPVALPEKGDGNTFAEGIFHEENASFIIVWKS